VNRSKFADENGKIIDDLVSRRGFELMPVRSELPAIYVIVCNPMKWKATTWLSSRCDYWAEWMEFAFY
jgi:hypothetical protein